MFRTEIIVCRSMFSALNALFPPRNVGAGGFRGFRAEIRLPACGKNVLNRSALSPVRGKTRSTARPGRDVDATRPMAHEKRAKPLRPLADGKGNALNPSLLLLLLRQDHKRGLPGLFRAFV